MKIKQWLIITDREHQESIRDIMKISKLYMKTENSDAISIIHLDTDDLSVISTISTLMIDGIILCPYVSCGYIDQLLNIAINPYTYPKDLFILTNATGDFISKLESIDPETCCNKFIHDLISPNDSPLNKTGVYFKGYKLLSKKLTPDIAGDYDGDPNFRLYNDPIFVPCGQKINVDAEENKEFLKAEQDFQNTTSITGSYPRQGKTIE